MNRFVVHDPEGAPAASPQPPRTFVGAGDDDVLVSVAVDRVGRQPGVWHRVVAVNLVTDLSYALIDPRVRYRKEHRMRPLAEFLTTSSPWRNSGCIRAAMHPDLLCAVAP